MLGTFVDKVSGLFDRRFLMGWWAPVFVTSAVALILALTPYGLDQAWTWWQGQEELAQTWMVVTALLLVTAFAYILRAFLRPMIRLYEGYWPQWLRRWPTKSVKRRVGRWNKAQIRAAQSDPERYADLQDALYYGYPSQTTLLLPTRLGNALRAAEEYGYVTYGLDSAFWWSRLADLLPVSTQEGISDALTPVATLLNLASLSAVVAVAGAIFWWQQRAGGWLGPALVLLLGLLLARVCYLGAVSQARSYGQQLRTAVDLYRWDLLKALHQPLPKTPQEERVLWHRLAMWLYNQDRGVLRGLDYHHE